MRILLLSLCLSSLSFFASCSAFAKPNVASPKTAATSLYDLKAKRISGEDASLSEYKGKVTLVVNTASECGFTPQYKGLQELYSEFAPKGFVVLGFPSNEFGGQEPGSAAEIKQFCELKYKVTFPMFDKVKTSGADQSPVYSFVTAQYGEPRWNFSKYLVNKKGAVIAAYASSTTPTSAELRTAIEKALAE